jgi:prepilin-type N-terminal cleavage/methylation domain-containing protein
MHRFGNAGFTLIEILAVIAILGLLMSLAIYNFSKHRQAGEAAATRARILTLGNEMQKYSTAKGGPPFDRLAKINVQCNNQINEGVEALFASLQNKDFPDGSILDEQWLANTDNDVTSTSFHRIAGFKNELFEVVDRWGNPFAYFHYTNYGSSQTVQMAEAAEGEDPTQVVTPWQSKKTGTFANPDSFQLISAGPDKIFGTIDDVSNFDYDRD